MSNKLVYHVTTSYHHTGKIATWDDFLGIFTTLPKCNKAIENYKKKLEGTDRNYITYTIKEIFLNEEQQPCWYKKELKDA